MSGISSSSKSRSRLSSSTISTRGLRCGVGLVDVMGHSFFRRRKLDNESAPQIDPRALGCNPPAMTGDDGMRNGQSQPDPGSLPTPIGKERFENALNRIRRHAAAIVFDRKFNRIVIAPK